MNFERLEKRQIFEGEIVALTPLHVGSGKPEVEIGAVDMPVLRNSAGTPYIPGSSIKGKVRSELERIARKLDMPVCNPPDTKRMCGTTNPRDLCVACRIFGTAGEKLSVASKVKFRDSISVGKIETTEVRSGIAIDRSTGSVRPRGLFSIEAVPTGSRFRFEMVTENLTDEEFAFLLAALKSVQDSALGGSSTRGFGKIRIDLQKVSERTPEFYLGKAEEKVLEGDQLTKWLKEKRVGIQ